MACIKKEGSPDCPFRISCTRTRFPRSPSPPPARGVSLPVQPPVLQAYKHIDLQRSCHSRRIQHLSTVQSLEEGLWGRGTGRDKWESTLGRYISNKEKIQLRKQAVSNEFEFLELSKINQLRKRRLVQQQYLPASTLAAHPEDPIAYPQLSPHHSPQPHSPHSPHTHSPLHHSHQQTDYASLQSFTSPLPQSRRYTESSSQQQRVLGQFVSSYFQKKYKKKVKGLERGRRLLERGKDRVKFDNIFIMQACGKTTTH